MAFEQSITGPDLQRVVYEYDVPESLQQVGNKIVKTISIKELTPEEELRASRRAGQDAAALANELWRESIAEINGTTVSLADGSTDSYANKFSSALRQLIMTAYSDIHNPKEVDAKVFLKSRRAKV